MNKEIESYKDSINNHIHALINITHTKEDYAHRLKDINWCIDQIILKAKEIKCT